LSTLTEVKAEVGERLVAGSHVEDLASNNILRSSRADGAAECLDLSNGVRILIEALLSEGTKKEESSLFVKVLLEDKLVWASVDFFRSFS